MHDPRTWDVFCRVVDNFGDAGVCLRLARQLAAEQRGSVRLWIDGIETLARLEPAIAAGAGKTPEGVVVERWPDPFPPVSPADVTVEAFGCGLPDSHAARMAADARRLWIVLEHLSAEAWVADWHGLPSPHPRWPVERYFFFPGFVPATGGLLREQDLFERRDAFGREQREAFWREAGHPAAPPEATLVSVFAYSSAPVIELLEAWAGGDRLTIAVIPANPALDPALRLFGMSAARAGASVRHGALEVRRVPFVPQRRYDELLWSCDVNFVRGEDSFVRAHWAARPLVWQAYPQAGGAHHAKVEAYLALFREGLDVAPAVAAGDMMRLWNGIAVPGVTLRHAWCRFVAQQAELRTHAARWARGIARHGDLARNLASFCRGKLKSPFLP
jgi:uncharacterized repeat protein (TIGR03837 family)